MTSIYDYWVATLQDGYIHGLVDIVDTAGGAKALYEMPPEKLEKLPGITKKLRDYIIDRRGSLIDMEESYKQTVESGVRYANHDEPDFPQKLRNIQGMPYGIFIIGNLPDPDKPSAAIIGARECSQYGRLMAEFFGSRLAKENVQIISGMANGIDGVAQLSAIDAGGRSFGVLGCGVDVVYPARNRALYEMLCTGGNGLISEYAPATPALPRNFPPRNRIISALCDVLIVVEARKKSGTLITVDMAIEQGKTVMIVPGRLTDELSAGCLHLLYQGALPATDIGSVLEQLGVGKQIKMSGIISSTGAQKKPPVPKELQKIAKLLSIEPQNSEVLSDLSNMTQKDVLIALSRLEMLGVAKEVWPGFFIKDISRDLRD